jgi:hypothetical protein
VAGWCTSLLTQSHLAASYIGCCCEDLQHSWLLYHPSKDELTAGFLFVAMTGSCEFVMKKYSGCLVGSCREDGCSCLVWQFMRVRLTSSSPSCHCLWSLVNDVKAGIWISAILVHPVNGRQEGSILCSSLINRTSWMGIGL